MSRCIRKPTKCLGENKGADQLCSNCTADQRLCFCYRDSTTPSIQNFKLLACFCLGENKGADQLCSNCTADQRLCFCYRDSTTPSIQNFKLLACFCGCTAWFVSHLEGNKNCCFCHTQARVTSVNLISLQTFVC